MAVQGIEVGPVTTWFEANVPSVRPPLSFSLIASGRSNLTFAVHDAEDSRWILRRPPLSHVLPTAHDMAREYRVISALGPTAVPVPDTFGLCEDLSVTGSPFYVMELVEGHIMRKTEQVEKQFAQPERRRIGDNLATTLALLHATDVDAVGLGKFGRREGYIERQVRRWSEQVKTMTEGRDAFAGTIARIAETLTARVPAQQGVAIVHGDYRLDNTVVGDDGEVRAVLDWEISTLGDPLADVGLLMVFWNEPSDIVPISGITAPSAPGMASRTDLLERYAAASGRDLSDIGYYTAFGYWKLGCILQGVYARYKAGATAGDPMTVDDMPTSIGHLFEMAAKALREDAP